MHSKDRSVADKIGTVLVLLSVGPEAPARIVGAIRDGFLEEKQFEPRSELSLSLNE